MWQALALNGLIFLSMFAVCTLHHWIEHRKHPDTDQHVAHALMAGVFNPATLDSVKDFLTHMLVYSGYVIPPH